MPEDKENQFRSNSIEYYHVEPYQDPPKCFNKRMQVHVNVHDVKTPISIFVLFEQCNLTLPIHILLLRITARNGLECKASICVLLFA